MSQGSVVTVEFITDLVRQMRFVEAEQLLQSAPSGKFVLGTVHESLGNADLAKRYYVSDGTINSIHNLGCMFIKEGDWARALQCFNAVVQADPTFVKSLNNAAVCSLNVDGSNVPAAIGYFAKIVEVTNTTSVPLHDADAMRKHQFMTDNAEQCAIALHNIGFLNMKMNNIDVCQAFLERSYDLLPDYPETLYTIGVLYNGFTLKYPPRGEAVDFLKSSHRFYAKSIGKELRNLNSYKLVGSRGSASAYELNSVTIAKGQMQTPNAIVFTHHDKHLPLHRWQIGAKHAQLAYAVNCLQYNSWGFYHWMVETLPRLATALALKLEPPYLVSDKPFVKELVQALGIEDKVVYVGSEDALTIARAIAVDWAPVDRYRYYPNYEFLVPKDLVQDVYKLLEPLRASAEAGDKLSCVVWLSRAKQTMRGCGNEDELCISLQKVCDARNAEFVRFVPDELPLAATLAVLGRCRVLAGIHGGAFSNMLYCPRGATVVESHMKENFYYSYFKDLADSLGHRHIGLAANVPNMFNARDLRVDIDKVCKIVDGVLDAESKLPRHI
jgi:capsular polysaccharide biosynthesis protein